jgi:hypothetical protein
VYEEGNLMLYFMGFVGLSALLGFGAFFLAVMIFPRKENPLKARARSCDDEWPDGAAMLEPNGNYDWSHIPDVPYVREQDLFE